MYPSRWVPQPGPQSGLPSFQKLPRESAVLQGLLLCNQGSARLSQQILCLCGWDCAQRGSLSAVSGPGHPLLAQSCSLWLPSHRALSTATRTPLKRGPACVTGSLGFSQLPRTSRMKPPEGPQHTSPSWAAL